MSSNINFDICKRKILIKLLEEVEFDLSESQKKFYSLDKIQELMEQKVLLSLSIPNVPDENIDFTFLLNSNKDEFFYFVHSGIKYDDEMKFGIYGYSKNLYYDWLEPEFKSLEIRECSLAEVEVLHKTTLFYNTVKTIKTLNQTPEFGRLFKVNPDNPNTLITTDEGLKSIAYLNNLSVSYRSIHETAELRFAYYMTYSEFKKKCEDGIEFVNKYHHKVRVFFDSISGTFEKILAHGITYDIKSLNIRESNLNIFTKSFSVGGFKDTNNEINGYKIYKNTIGSTLHYNPTTNLYTAIHHEDDYEKEELVESDDDIDDDVLTTIFDNEKLDEFTTYETETHIRSDGDLILKDDYETVISPKYLENMKKRETKNHVFVSLNMFDYAVLCDLYDEPNYRTDGISINVGKGRLLFFEMLKYLYKNGFVWVILYPGCQKAWKSTLIKMYDKWGVKNIIRSKKGLHMYDKIENVLRYENK
jgi:hypothetical protein